MSELLYAVSGVVATIVAFLFLKLFGSGKKEPTPETPAIPKPAQDAMVNAAEALTARAESEAKGDEAKKKLEEAKKEQDPAKKIQMLAELVKDL